MNGGMWLWVGHLWSDRVQMVLDRYGDRITDLSIFGWRVNAAGVLTPTFPASNLDATRAKWPHIRFWGCFRNMDDPQDDPATIWAALRNNPAARASLAAGVQGVLDDYPWLSGIDIDLEKGGAASNTPAAVEVFRVIADAVHARGKLVSAALPAVTAEGSVGSEDWVDYYQLGQQLDHLSIMSYDFAWGGSAPGPISPRWWLEEVYDWAVTQVDPSKLSMGLPCYGRGWFIHRAPGPSEYRGSSLTYYAARNVLDGTWLTSSTQANPAGNNEQHHIGWLAYRDPESGCPFALPHVYDWVEPDSPSSSSGMKTGDWNGHKYSVRYSKASGDPMWSVADNSLTTEYSVFPLSASPMRDVDGNWVGPKGPWTLTVELLQRPPDSATIIDDDMRSGDLYTGTGEWWTDGTLNQWRGPGYLVTKKSWYHDRPLHVMVRFQFPEASAMTLSAPSVSGTLTSDGALTCQAQWPDSRTWTTVIPPVKLSNTPGEGLFTFAFRIRGNHVRVYAGEEEQPPMVMEFDTNLDITNDEVMTYVVVQGPVWVDRIRIGDGWWYQQREAVAVQLGDWQWTLGRVPRHDVIWDDAGRFRPINDVEESATRSQDISMDWEFFHIPDFPITLGQSKSLIIRPLDVDCWLGRIFLCDGAGAQIAWYSDATYLAGWMDEARYRWGLQGVALWTLGQEDVRLYERIQGGGEPKINV
jgi:spore germination protein YaaH